MKSAEPFDIEHWFVFKLLRKHAVAAILIAGCVVLCVKMIHCEVCLSVLSYRM